MAQLQVAGEDFMSAMEAQHGQKPGRLIVHFFMGATHLETESKKAGRPIFKDEPYIRIIVPGDKDNIVVRPVRSTDADLYPTEWQKWKNKQEAPVQGTPLSTLPFVSPAQVAEMNAINVHTAEQLVGMPDVHAGKVMGIQKLKKRVQEFLDAAAGAAPTEALRTELAKRDEEIGVMKRNLEEQAKQIAQLMNKR